ncbi:DISARM system phospholipase D-like protein DrmC [Symbiobacterium thermophilum]|uniref:Conserved domain protein n=1 Tax=Symbiobacterium thermophilum (strain DSM 24528 / JCM 14929 / IAM 14863 / T) TaxID=292459 RepID=Q67PV4_SYMTH|nr:DISARM system phospholipase D-like protein DrmC [Symbiobacterium thermophilum]BAD40289.1 conserved domain protein [Symbiobacterium thermophilum IAM 14863]
MNPKLELSLVALAESAGDDALAALRALLAAERIGPGTTLHEVRTLLAPHRIDDHLLAPFLKLWAATGATAVPGPALALALGVAHATRARAERRAPRISPVWTGPYAPPGVQARSTLAVMQEMVEGARARILLVGYALTGESPEAVRLVLALARRAAQGVQVAIALHDDGKNHDTLLNLWPERIPLSLLRWTGRPDVPKASLHAKLLVVDSRDLLVTSANLTHLGLDKNIEFGVRIQGQVAHEIDRHFAALVRDAVLVEYDRSQEE